VTSLPQVSRHSSLSVSSSQVRHETMMITSAARQVPDRLAAESRIGLCP